MIRDRGRIKWTAMMLPEHVEQLRDWQKEDQHQLRQQPDEQQMEEWNYQIQEAIERNLQLTVHYWQDQRIMIVSGIIGKIDIQGGMFQLNSQAGRTYTIPFVNLKSISDFE
ncbi:YolD-like family protein [Sporosarcina thermotolerans]|uniref:YolD-like family protein n=1 Tax=Sporosarcina thermotolerans TaxID=633404 RepID=A0AAW9A5P6_9BACL|nr:YolD-like family protein [Sporosarcina thermotolerans]MDW0115500.1 YolD-like family protein [Sporosarcina thermotolerans]WHT47176.1 YolD-like family protein [Sporosarcina thermotolerans]